MTAVAAEKERSFQHKAEIENENEINGIWFNVPNNRSQVEWKK